MNLKKMNLWAVLAFMMSFNAFAFSQEQENETTAEEVIERYLDAIGGEEALRNIKTAKVEMVSEVQGMVLNMFFVHDDENKRMSQRVMVMGNEASNVTVKDGKAKVVAMGQEQELTDEQFEEARMNMHIFPELHFKDSGFELSYEGTETVNDEEAHKIIVTNKNGVKQTNFYSVESGLKVRNENPSAGDTSYLAYDEFDGVKYPTELSVKSPMLPEAMLTTVESVEFNVELSDDDFE
jgi:zinc protease